ncbi:hypothetical protein FA13DRAFT_1800923 [Coprinellus micaceus]|uniref:Uncharacterized protein n=1 Tax=Coprinellus micaceus TaxID=71717 RepID=A0A4Y7SF24_COPMI|nr:hypothetical protein FA13DRAFT_1800923 [Coprinellus micaceus]
MPYRRQHEYSGEDFSDDLHNIQDFPSDEEDEPTGRLQHPRRPSHTTSSQMHTSNMRSSNTGVCSRPPVSGTGTFNLGDLNEQIERLVQERCDTQLREVQLENTDLREQVRRLTVESHQLQNRLTRAGIRFNASQPGNAAGLEEATSTTQTQPTKSKSPTTGNKDVDDELAKHFRRIMLMCYGFPKTAWMGGTRADTPSLHPARYDSEENELQAFVTMIYEEMPEHLHPDLHREVVKTFCRATAKSFMRTNIDKLRGYAHIIFQLPHLQESYAHSADRTNIPHEFRSLVTWPDGYIRSPIPGVPEDKTGFILPVLFPSGVQDVKQMFYNPCLPLILRGAIWGPKSITAGSFCIEKVQTATFGKLWENTVKSVTPGSIALVASWAIFMHNTDATFAEVGTVSGFHYDDAINFYLQFLNCMILAGGGRKKWVDELVVWYNSIVFKSKHKAAPSGVDGRVNRNMVMSGLLASFPDPNSPIGMSGSKVSTSGPSSTGIRSEPLEHIEGLEEIEPGVFTEQELGNADHQGPQPTKKGKGRGRKAQMTDQGAVEQHVGRRSTRNRG